jgi:ribose-phosphate pyrophosphokinase
MINRSIRGKHAYVVQDIENHYPINGKRYSVHDNYMHLRMLIDACNRCDAGKVTVVMPVYPYSRQDKSMTREGITASLVAS